MAGEGSAGGSRRRWPLLAGAGVLVLLVAGAAIFYFAALPGILAADYKDQARPEHEKVRTAMSRVYDTFNARTITGTSTRELKRAKGPDAFIHALHRVVARERRIFRPVQARIKDARRALRAADRKALADVADPPAIGGSSELDRANGVAAAERRYLRSAASYLSSYGRLIDFYNAELKFLQQASTSLAKGFANLPKHPGSPEAFAGPVDRIAGKLEREVRAGHRLKVPADEKRQHRELLSLFKDYAGNIRRFADAVRARDLAKVKAFPHQLSATAKHYKNAGRGSVGRLLTRSAYSRAIKGLKRLEDRIAQDYERL